MIGINLIMNEDFDLLVEIVTNRMSQEIDVLSNIINDLTTIVEKDRERIKRLENELETLKTGITTDDVEIYH